MIIIFFVILLSVIYYSLIVLPRYLIAKKQNLNNPKFIFIPLLTNIKSFNMSNLSGFFIIPLLLFFICSFLSFDVLAFIFLTIYGFFILYKNYRLFKSFDFSQAGCILGIFFSLIAYWFIAIDNQTLYLNSPKDKYISII